MIFLETLLMFPFAITHIFYEMYLLSAIQFGLGFVFLAVLFTPNATLPVRYKENIAIFSLIVLFWAMLALGGIANTGIYWSPMLPFVVFTMSGIAKGFKWLVIYVFGVFALQALHFFSHIRIPYSYEQLTYFLSAFAVYTIIALIFEEVLSRYRDHLEDFNRQLQQSKKELKRVLEHLEMEVENQTIELKTSNQKLQQEIAQHKETNRVLAVTKQEFFEAQKMEALGTMIRGVAQNFSGKLAAIEKNLFVIQRNIKGNAVVQERLDDIEKDVFHASEMTRQLLTFSRNDDAAKTKLEFKALLHEALNLAAIALPSHVQVKARVSESSMPILGNDQQLQQVMLNLMHNASEAMRHCDQKLIKVYASPLSEATGKRGVHPELHGEWLYVCIQDSGAGIPKENLSRVFEPFFTTKESKSGIGLGLSMCYGAMQSHGGVIEVESAPGEGASFHLYLPLQQDIHNMPVHYPIKDKQLFGKGETILIVDQNKSVFHAHERILIGLNYNLIWAENEQETLEQVASESIELVILDLDLLEWACRDVAIRMLQIRPELKLICCTATDGEKDEPFVAGFSQVRRLNKPFSVELLCTTLSEELNKPASE